MIQVEEKNIFYNITNGDLRAKLSILKSIDIYTIHGYIDKKSSFQYVVQIGKGIISREFIDMEILNLPQVQSRIESFVSEITDFVENELAKIDF